MAKQGNLILKKIDLKAKYLVSLFLILVFTFVLSHFPSISSENVAAIEQKVSQYYPGRGDDWEKRKPEELGMDPRMIQDAIDFATSLRWTCLEIVTVSYFSGISTSVRSKPYVSG